MKKIINWSIGILSLIGLTTVLPITIIKTLTSNSAKLNITEENNNNKNEKPKKINNFYPDFLKNITFAKLKVINGKSLIHDLDKNIKNNDLSIGFNSIRTKLNLILNEHISQYGYMYLLNDIKQYIYDIWENNKNYFSFVDAKIPTIKNISKNKMDVNIFGSFVLKNKTKEKQKLVDNENKFLFNLRSINPNEKVTINFSNYLNFDNDKDKQNAIIPILNNLHNKIYLNWFVPNFQMNFEFENEKFETSFKQFVFNKNISYTNINFVKTKLAYDPYTSKNNIVGKNKKFNIDLINKNQVKNDLNLHVKGKLNFYVSISQSMSKLLRTIIDLQNSSKNYLIADVITKNAKNISENLSLIYPEFNNLISNKTSIKEFIYDLLTNYSQTKINSNDFYDLLYKHRYILFNFFNKLFSELNEKELDISEIFNEINSGKQFFDLLSNLVKQANLVLTGKNYKPLLNLLNSLTESKDVYLFDFLSKKENATNLIDTLINIENMELDLKNNKSIEFIKEYRVFLIKLISSSKNWISEITYNLLEDGIDSDGKVLKKAMLMNILKMVGFNFNLLLNSNNFEKIFEILILNNNSIEPNEKTFENVLNLLNQISFFLQNINLNKIKIINKEEENNFNIEYSENGNDLLVKNLNESFDLKINNFEIPVSLINAFLNFLPSNSLKETLDKFLDDKTLDFIRNKSYDQIKEYITKKFSWVPSWLIDLNKLSQNIAYGENGKNGIVDQMLSNIKNNLNPKASLKTLFQEILFGSFEFDSTKPWININGILKIKYSGNNLYVLPTYNYDFFKNLKMNYQIIGATLTIDSKNLANQIQINDQSNKLNINHVIPTYQLSNQLHNSFINFSKNFINDMVNRNYNLLSNIYLEPIENKNKFMLNLNNEKEVIDPYLYLNNYDFKYSDLLDENQISQTKLKIFNKSWNWNNQYPSIDNDSINFINHLINLNDVFYEKQLKYIVNTISLFGIRQSSFNLKIFENVYVGNPLIKKIPIPFKINFLFELRAIQKIIIFPYPIFDKTNNKFVNSIHLNLSTFISDLKYSIL
ncbi:P116 family lipid acquisition surface protein [Mycoplasmoides pirum]|uniref:P116 family lipid acquisition surface protein n=1 Tax=Mycoplasmoides pirum TaxID=2122 RepID=UPI000489736C|nr:hypothetical protein [Mycoplasmoides pirum]